MASANDAVRVIVEQFATAGGYSLHDTAFLDCAPPTLAESIDSLVERGAERILVVPYFLTLGIHLQRDLPSIIAKISEKHHGMDIRVTPPLDGHPALSQILLERTRAGLGSWESGSAQDPAATETEWSS